MTDSGVSPPERGRGYPWRIWGLAALGALFLHGASVAMVVSQIQPEETEDANGATAIDIGLEFTAPHDEETDLPPGPEAEASAASPAVQEQQAVAAPSDLPQDTPTETEDPDRVVTRQKVEKPKEDDPKVAAQPTAASNESVASEATAAPTSEKAIEAPKSAAPVIGAGDSARRVILAWQKQLVAHLDRHKRYPANGSRKNVQIVIDFTLDRTGHVLASNIVKSSGDAAYDEAAIAMLKRSDPVPAPPPLIADEGLTFTVPVIFRAKGGN